MLNYQSSLHLLYPSLSSVISAISLYENQNQNDLQQQIFQPQLFQQKQQQYINPIVNQISNNGTIYNPNTNTSLNSLQMNIPLSQIIQSNSQLSLQHSDSQFIHSPKSRSISPITHFSPIYEDWNNRSQLLSQQELQNVQSFGSQINSNQLDMIKETCKDDKAIDKNISDKSNQQQYIVDKEIQQRGKQKEIEPEQIIKNQKFGTNQLNNNKDSKQQTQQFNSPSKSKFPQSQHVQYQFRQLQEPQHQQTKQLNSRKLTPLQGINNYSNAKSNNNIPYNQQSHSSRTSNRSYQNKSSAQQQKSQNTSNDQLNNTEIAQTQNNLNLSSLQTPITNHNIPLQIPIDIQISQFPLIADAIFKKQNLNDNIDISQKNKNINDDCSNSNNQNSTIDISNLNYNYIQSQIQMYNYQDGQKNQIQQQQQINNIQGDKTIDLKEIETIKEEREQKSDNAKRRNKEQTVIIPHSNMQLVIQALDNDPSIQSNSKSNFQEIKKPNYLPIKQSLGDQLRSQSVILKSDNQLIQNLKDHENNNDLIQTHEDSNNKNQLLNRKKQSFETDLKDKQNLSQTVNVQKQRQQSMHSLQSSLKAQTSTPSQRMNSRAISASHKSQNTKIQFSLSTNQEQNSKMSGKQAQFQLTPIQQSHQSLQNEQLKLNLSQIPQSQMYQSNHLTPLINSPSVSKQQTQYSPIISSLNTKKISPYSSSRSQQKILSNSQLISPQYSAIVNNKMQNNVINE